MLRLLWLAVVASVGAGCAGVKSPCAIHSDCGAGAYCANGICRTDCRTDFDCAAGVCQKEIGRCAVAPDGGVTPPADLAMSAPPPDLAGPPEPDLARPPLAAYGDVCRVDGECA